MLKAIETIKMLPACLPSGWHDHHCPSCLCPAITIQLVPYKYSENFADIYLLWKHVSLVHLPLIMMLKDMARKIIWFQKCIFLVSVDWVLQRQMIWVWVKKLTGPDMLLTSPFPLFSSIAWKMGKSACSNHCPDTCECACRVVVQVMITIECL